MSTLVVFDSNLDETRRIAEAIASECGADSEMIREAKSAEGTMGFRKDVLRKTGSYEQVGEPIHDLRQYDVVAIGTPARDGHPSDAVSSFIKAYGDHIREVAFFVVADGSSTTEPLQEMTQMCGKKPVATATLGADEGLDQRDRISQFAAAIRH